MEVGSFENINKLIYRYSSFVWKFSTDNFKTVILKEELELGNYLLKKPELREVLNDHEIQLYIIENYIS